MRTISSDSAMPHHRFLQDIHILNSRLFQRGVALAINGLYLGYKMGHNRVITSYNSAVILTLPKHNNSPSFPQPAQFFPQLPSYLTAVPNCSWTCRWRPENPLSLPVPYSESPPR